MSNICGWRPVDKRGHGRYISYHRNVLTFTYVDTNGRYSVSFTAVTGVRIPLGTPPLKNTIDAQGFFGVIVPPDATAGKSGTLLLPFRASNSGAAAASSLARFAFLV
jgi:hypothetical protein